MQNLIKEKKEYTKQEIVSLLKITDPLALGDLYQLADSIRAKYVGNEVHLQGIIEISNYCSKNCLYCGIRRSNEKIHRYRYSKSQIIEAAKKAEKAGYKTILLLAGEDEELDIELLVEIIKEIKRTTKLALTFSIGEKPEIEYRLMKEAGADRYLLKHETSDPMLYRQLHPDLKYSDRIKCLRAIKQQGYDTGSGIMVGLPGQTFESIANDILLFKSLDIDMIYIGPYLPHPETPVAKKFNQAGGYFAPAIGYFDIENMIYKIIAITRIVAQKIDIPATTSIETINDKDGQELALKSGANIVMVNVSTPEYRKYYEVYPARTCIDPKKQVSRKEIEARIRSIGRLPV